MTVHTAGGHLATGGDVVRHGAWNTYGPFSLGDHTDDGLDSVKLAFTRDLEDAEAGRAPGLDAARLRAEIDAIESEQWLRGRLRFRGASENGTHSFADYEAGGGMKLHVADDGEKSIVCDPAPSYPLALMLDYRGYRDGAKSVLDWEFIEEGMGGRERTAQAFAVTWLSGVA